MAKALAGATDPTAEPSARFDPATDAENAAAHGEESPDARSGSERVDEIQATVRGALERALDHYQDTLEPDQKEATDYYYGRPFGDEEDGRSKVVSTDVRDATRAQLPSLMRVFFGPERAVEFRPRGLEDEPMARQMTDTVGYVVREENPGFLILYSAFKDALVRRLGVLKWWWDETYRVSASDYTGLDTDGVLALLSDPGVEDFDITGQDGETYDVRITRKEASGCPRFAAVPPEEFVFTPHARSLEDAPLVAHVREVPAEDLLQMGVDADVIAEAAGRRRSVSDEDLAFARSFDGDTASRFDEGDDEVLDPSQRPVLYAEAYALIDGADDGVAEIRLFRCVGPEFRITNGDGLGEVVDEVPFAVLTPEPEPHTLIGLSNFDLLRDVQRVKSQVLRGTLNSLALAIEPKTEVVEGEVNMQDLINPEISGIVRVTKPGMQREIVHTFVGPDALPVLEYYDGIKEERTGITKASQGLDADSLQSSTKAAVAGTFAAAQQQIEMIARVFAETGIRRLFKGILGLMCRHQDRPRTVRLRGTYVEIDPRQWDATMDVSINVALGQGAPEDRIATLSSILAAQQAAKEMGAPFVSWVEIRNALAKGAELAGWHNPDQFFRPWGMAEEQQMQAAMANQPPAPDPNMALVQVEAAKAQSQMQIEQLKAEVQRSIEAQKMELERWKAQMQDDRERDKAARDAALKQFEIEMEYQSKIADAALRTRIEQERAEIDERVRREQTHLQAAVQHAANETNAEVQREASRGGDE
jgi:hypothetical protein